MFGWAFFGVTGLGILALPLAHAYVERLITAADQLPTTGPLRDTGRPVM